MEALHPCQTFANVVAGNFCGTLPIRQYSDPRIVGVKIAITIDEKEYKQSLLQFKWGLMGRLMLMKGDKPITTKDIKLKLSVI